MKVNLVEHYTSKEAKECSVCGKPIRKGERASHFLINNGEDNLSPMAEHHAHQDCFRAIDSIVDLAGTIYDKHEVTGLPI